MVTVKKEVPVESAVLDDIQQWDFDQSGGPADAAGHVPLMKQQQFWSHPGPAGPQEKYESEFQVQPLTSFLANNPQPKPDDRTIPTTLDRYEMQLKLLEQQKKKRAGHPSKGQQSEEWTPPPGWNEFLTADYQTQLKLLEEQNEARLQMAGTEQESMRPVSGSIWTPPPGWKESLLPDYQEALKYLEQQDKERRAMSGEDNDTSMAPPITTSRGTTVRLMSSEGENSGMPSLPPQPGLPFAAKADYQMQLMLLESQNKKRLMMARQEQDAMLGRRDHGMPLKLLEQQNKKQLMMARQYQGAMAGPNRPSTSDIGAGFREQSVESNSTWSTQFTPESTPGFQHERESSICGLNQIQLNFMEPHPQRSDSGQSSPQSFCNCASSGQILRDDHVQVHMLEQQNRANATMVKREDDDTAASSTVPSWSLQHYQAELMLKEQRDKAEIEMRRCQEREMTVPVPSSRGNHAFQDYEAQLALLDQQNKRRRMMIQTQLMLLEQQSKKQLIMAREETESQPSASAISLEKNLDEEHGVDGRGWISYGSRDLHKKPLVIRKRPTCDD